MFRTYALAPETVARILRGTIWRFQILVTLSFLVFGLYLALFAGPVRWSIAGPMVGMVALAYFFIIFFTYRTQLRLLYSIRYEIDGSSVIFRQLKQDPLRIMRADMVAVEPRSDGLLIHTVDEDGKLLIPYGLARNGDQDVLSTLEAWVGIHARAKRSRFPVRKMVIIGTGGALLILLFANSLLITLVLGVLVIVLGTFTERRLIHVKEAPPGEVQMYNMAFSFLVFILIMKSCFIAMAMAMAR